MTSAQAKLPHCSSHTYRFAYQSIQMHGCRIRCVTNTATGYPVSNKANSTFLTHPAGLCFIDFLFVTDTSLIRQRVH